MPNLLPGPSLISAPPGDRMTTALQVLIVEDSQADSRLMVRMLRKNGYEVTHQVVEDEAQFIDALQSATFDIILCDNSLPAFSALGVLQTLKGLDHDIPVIVVSGSISEEQIVNLMLAGAANYVMKDKLSLLPIAVERTLEHASQRRHLEVARAQDRLRAAALEQAAESVMICDVRGDLEYVNGGFETTTGYSREEVLGRNPRFLKSGEQCCEFYQQMWDQLLNGERWQGRFTNRRKDGSTYQEDAVLSPVRNASGEIAHIVAVKRDVTNENLLETQLHQAQRLESVGRLAGGIAHDFNNLLTVINATADIVLESLEEVDPIKQDIETILQAGQRSATLTRQLLAFSRRQVLRPVPLNLNDLVANLQTLLTRLLGEDIRIRSILAPDLGMTLADAGQIEQVIVNLAVNARDAMASGGTLTLETAEVHLDEYYTRRHQGVKPGHYIQLAVSDTGVGMTQTVKAQIFEPFFSTKGPDKGTGLGLATAYGIIKQSKGNIWVYSEPGKGTTFKIYLPRIDEVSDVARPAAQSSAPVRAATGTILLAEDEEQLRSLITRVLTRNGYTVIAGENGAAALALARSHDGPLDLVLTDVIMPEMGGRELVIQLSKERPGVKVLYISGYTDNAIMSQGVLNPGTDLLEKPFSPSCLLRRVQEVLNR